jgi:uncharacterized protein
MTTRHSSWASRPARLRSAGRVSRVPFLLCSLFVIVFAGCSGTNLSRPHLSIATGSPAGTYHPVGMTLATLLERAFSGCRVHVLETGGSIENLALVESGKAQLAIVQNDVAYYGARGERMFMGRKMTNVKGIAPLFSELVHIVARADTGIRTLHDFAGKKIGVGTSDSGTFHNAQQILTAAGIWERIDPQPMGVSDGYRALQQGSIAALFFTTSAPNPRLADLARSVPLVIVPLHPDLVQQLVNDYPFYFPSSLAAGTYHGQNEQVSALEIPAILVVGTTLTDEDHFQITRTLFFDLPKLAALQPRLKEATKASLRRRVAPELSPGADRALQSLP